jgi:cell division transport system permease protein
VNDARPAPAKLVRYGEPMAAEINPLVPDDGVTSRALLALVAILSFLAALALGAMLIVQGVAGEWRADIAREITIELRPLPGRDLDADARRAEEIMKALAVVADVHAFTKADTQRLLAPWLGTGADLSALPVPRLVQVRIDAKAAPDLDRVRLALAAALPNATLNDHTGFASRLAAISDAVTLGGLGVLTLILAATMLAVCFATRGAVAANRTVVEVLHFVGASDGFVARTFARHFLVLGIKGGLIGAGAAAVLFGLARLLMSILGGGPASGAFFYGRLALDWRGFLWIAAIAAATTLTAALSSHFTVHRTLQRID